MRKITVTVKPQAKQDRVEVLSVREFRVSVKAPPNEGKANEAVIRVLADYFSVPKSRISITHGLASKHKRIEILD